MKKPIGKIKRLIRAHLRERERGGKCFEKSAEALKKARELGLQVDEQIEVTIIRDDGRPKVETFALVDNFVGEAAYRSARVPHFELKKVPKGAIREAVAEAAP
jgi:hypothetical protein